LRPAQCADDGFPKPDNMAGRIASQASGRSAVVALSSR